MPLACQGDNSSSTRRCSEVGGADELRFNCSDLAPGASGCAVSVSDPVLVLPGHNRRPEAWFGCLSLALSEAGGDARVPGHPHGAGGGTALELGVLQEWPLKVRPGHRGWLWLGSL